MNVATGLALESYPSQPEDCLLLADRAFDERLCEARRHLLGQRGWNSPASRHPRLKNPPPT